MIEALQAKRAALVSSQEQLIGQINRVGGAISVIDELIAEIPAPEDVPVGGSISVRDAIRRAVEESRAIYLDAPPSTVAHAAQNAPEMLPVSKFEPCFGCDQPFLCEEVGCSDVPKKGR